MRIETNYQIAAESLTLLKNDGILPLQAGKKILVTGYASNSINILNGAWSRTFWVSCQILMILPNQHPRINPINQREQHHLWAGN